LVDDVLCELVGALNGIARFAALVAPIDVSFNRSGYAASTRLAEL
jgi:hypothetical protein